MNFATSQTFGPVQYLLVYQTLAKRFAHDVVLVGFLPENDFTDSNWEIGQKAFYNRYRPVLRRRRRRLRAGALQQGLFRRPRRPARAGTGVSVERHHDRARGASGLCHPSLPDRDRRPDRPGGGAAHQGGAVVLLTTVGPIRRSRTRWIAGARRRGASGRHRHHSDAARPAQPEGPRAAAFAVLVCADEPRAGLHLRRLSCRCSPPMPEDWSSYYHACDHHWTSRPTRWRPSCWPR